MRKIERLCPHGTPLLALVQSGMPFLLFPLPTDMTNQMYVFMLKTCSEHVQHIWTAELTAHPGIFQVTSAVLNFNPAELVLCCPAHPSGHLTGVSEASTASLP